MVTVKVFQNRTEAEVTKGFLASRGIESFITADDNGGMDPYPMQIVYGVFLKVSEKDLKKAKSLLDQTA